MCGRFYLHAALSDLAVAFAIPPGSGALPNLPPRYNIAPTQTSAVVRLDASGTREIAALHWGLVPAWAKDTGIAARTINARSETAHEKPAFAQAFARRRCLVLANGYYEWPLLDGHKTPVSNHLADGGVMAMAGLWERWEGPNGDPRPTALETFTILTCPPNQIMAPLHDRMPVVLTDPGAQAAWLDPDLPLSQARSLCRPAPDACLRWAPVDRRVGNVRFDDPALLAPLHGEAPALPEPPPLPRQQSLL